MKRGVSDPNHETNQNTRSTNEMASSKSLLGQITEVTTSFSTLGFVESREPRKRHPDNNEENPMESGLFKCSKLRQIDESNKVEQCSSYTILLQSSIDQLPEEVFSAILRFSDYPKASQVPGTFTARKKRLCARNITLTKNIIVLYSIQMKVVTMKLLSCNNKKLNTF